MKNSNCIISSSKIKNRRKIIKLLNIYIHIQIYTYLNLTTIEQEEEKSKLKALSLNRNKRLFGLAGLFV